MHGALDSRIELCYTPVMSKALSFRLPEVTLSRLHDICRLYGTTQTQTMILSIDHLWRKAMNASEFLKQSENRSWYPNFDEFSEAWNTATPPQKAKLSELHGAWAARLDIDYDLWAIRPISTG